MAGKFEWQMLMDQQAYNSRHCAEQAGMFMSLKKAGARVFLCTDSDGQQFYGPNAHPAHIKAIAIDGKTVYAGSCNLIWTSRKNAELVFRRDATAAQQDCDGLRRCLENAKPL